MGDRVGEEPLVIMILKNPWGQGPRLLSNRHRRQSFVPNFFWTCQETPTPTSSGFCFHLAFGFFAFESSIVTG